MEIKLSRGGVRIAGIYAVIEFICSSVAQEKHPVWLDITKIEHKILGTKHVWKTKYSRANLSVSRGRRSRTHNGSCNYHMIRVLWSHWYNKNNTKHPPQGQTNSKHTHSYKEIILGGKSKFMLKDILGGDCITISQN